jgi:hypothetical protein
MFTAHEGPKFMAWAANLLQGGVKQFLQGRWQICGCLEGTNAYGMEDGNIQGKGNTGGYNERCSMFAGKEDWMVTTQPSLATTAQ